MAFLNKTYRTATKVEYDEIMEEVLKWYQDCPTHHMFYDDMNSKRPSYMTRVSIGEFLANQRGLSLANQDTIAEGLRYRNLNKSL